jgi:hypothetical protein
MFDFKYVWSTGNQLRGELAFGLFQLASFGIALDGRMLFRLDYN